MHTHKWMHEYSHIHSFTLRQIVTQRDIDTDSHRDTTVQLNCITHSHTHTPTKTHTWRETQKHTPRDTLTHTLRHILTNKTSHPHTLSHTHTQYIWCETPALGVRPCILQDKSVLSVVLSDNPSHAIFVPQGRVNRVGRVCVCVHIMGFGALIVEING